MNKEIKTLREHIVYADREEKIYLRNELNLKRDKYDLLNRDEKDINLYLSTPYLTKVDIEDDGIYISKYKKDFNTYSNDKSEIIKDLYNDLYDINH